MALSSQSQKRLEIQGYQCSSDQAFARVAPWLRFTPAVCTSLIAVATITASTTLFWILVPIAVLGAIFPVHPFDLLYNHAVRFLAGTGPLPKNGAPRRFACGLEAAWIAATAWAFGSGAAATGYILGGVLTGVGTLVSSTDICIPSMIFGAIFRRNLKAAS